ncbi:OmpA family protein [Muriicola sp.]|uniref:OmpA family protein n=4 Tax=Muriicola sp. TaxID=2020856 RepID=UPI00356A3689
MNIKLHIRNILLASFLLVSALAVAQKRGSKADVLFFEYKYNEAIREYLQEMRKAPLTNDQTINLAEAYFKTGNIDRAAETYSQVYKKEGKIRDSYFNTLMQVLVRTVGRDSAMTFFYEQSQASDPFLNENAGFNYDLIRTNDTMGLRFDIFNVNVNSPQSDFAPAFYKDQVLFTTGRPQVSKKSSNPTGESYLDIFVANSNNQGNLISASPFQGVPEFKYHQGTPFHSEALKSVFYVRSNEQAGELVFDQNGKNSLAMGSTDPGGNFRFLLKDLSTSFYYPFYEAQSGKLYFAANFEDGFGGTDLYYVYTNNGLIMSSPINLGPRINTPGNEIAPYIFEGSLYFASDVFYGLGGMDTYKSDILEENTYSIPVNLGRGLNSEKDDFGFIIKNYRENSLIGYLGSNRPGGKGSDDLYGFIIEDKPGIKTFTLSGSVVNLQTNERIPDAEIRLLDKEGKIIKQGQTDDKGMFRIEIPWQEAITVEATKDRYSTFSDTFAGDDMDEIQNDSFNMGIVSIDDLVEKAEDQRVLKLNKFYFDKGRSAITPEIAAELDKVVDAVSRFPQLQLRIESHTDSRGGAATNFRISQSRADAIKNYLENNGVSPSNILYSIGYGEDKLLNDCTDGVFCLDTFHKKNERQLIVVLNYDLLF